MPAASFQLLSPWGALAGLAALAPLVALLYGARRLARIRGALRLPPAPRSALALDAALLAVGALLVAAAAAQPALVERKGTRVRTDAQAYIVVDTSGSMLAAARPGAPTRFERARDAAIRLRSSLAGIETGLATMTDRILPNLLPIGDPAPFDTTAERSLRAGEPPPRHQDVLSTDLQSLADVGPGGFFAPSARSRVLILLTDGETKPFDPGTVASSLGGRPAISLVLIRIGGQGERVWLGARPDPNYRADPGAGAQLETLTRATGGALYGESGLDAAAAQARSALGVGPSALRGEEPTATTLAPWIALVALVPLGLLWLRLVGSGTPGSRSRLGSGRQAGKQGAVTSEASGRVV